MAQEIKEFGSLIELLEDLHQQNLPSHDILQRVRRFMEVKARAKAVPIRGSFELTPLCNLSCKMCYVHLTKKQLANESSKLLSGKEWIQIIKQAIDLGMIEASLTGGEALLHPDFEEIFLFLESKHLQINLKSNGLLLTENRINFLKTHHITSIQISLYGNDESSYEKVTGYQGFAKTMAAIENIRRFDIPLEIVITPNKYIWSNIEPLLQLVDNLGVQYSVNPGLIVPLEETGRAGINHDLTLEQYIELNKIIANMKGCVLSPTCAEDIPKQGSSFDQEILGMQCAAGRSVFSVSWRGTVHPCRMLENIGFDALSFPFAEGWRQINEAVKAYPFPRECVGCDFAHLCPSCVIQHGYGAPSGHANPAICLRAQRMTEEGFYFFRNGD